MNRIIFGVLAVALIVVLLSCLQNFPGPGGGGPDGVGGYKEQDAEWDTLKSGAIRDVEVGGGWSAARLVEGEVNSIGWEDSADISPDGNTLHFSYIPCDLFGWTSKTGGDLSKFEPYKRGPMRDTVPAFSLNTLVSKKVNGVWSKPELSIVSRDTQPPYQSEVGLQLTENGDVYYNTNYPTTEKDNDTDIYKNRDRLPFNDKYGDNDPYFRNGELFFWSEDRPGAPGKKSLWVTRETSPGNWSAPRPLPAPINLPGKETWQPCMSPSNTLYFASNRDGYFSIYASRRTAPDTYETPVRVVWPKLTGQVKAISEPSITADEKQLYFVVMFQNAQGHSDLDIAYCTKP